MASETRMMHTGELETPYASGGIWAPDEKEKKKFKEETFAEVLIRKAKRKEIAKKSSHYNQQRNSKFRQLYEQEQLPVRIMHEGSRRRIGWLTDDILQLDISFYLPLFVEAFRDPDEPIAFLAHEAALDIISLAGPANRILTLGPSLNTPLKLALRSQQDHKPPLRALAFLHAYLTCSEHGPSVYALALDLKVLAAAIDAAVYRHGTNLLDAATTLLSFLAASSAVARTSIRAAIPGFESRYLHQKRAGFSRQKQRHT